MTPTRLIATIALAVVTAVASAAPSGQPLPERWFDTTSIGCTVLIEVQDSGGFRPFDTGFLMWNYDAPLRPVVVTCAHLLVNRPEVWLAVTAESTLVETMRRQKTTCLDIDGCEWDLRQGTLHHRVQLQEGKTFVRHPDPSIDVAAFPVSITSIGSETKSGSELRLSRTSKIPKSFTKLRGDCRLGDEVFFVGFPFGFGASDSLLTPLVRSGSIAWYRRDSPRFLLDAFSYGGNSGGPVFLKRTGELRAPYLVGLISGHYPNDPYVNFGLAECVWTDEILPVMQAAVELGGR